MKKQLKTLVAGLIASSVLMTAAFADPHHYQKKFVYEISITNLTNSAFLSEPVVASHTHDFKVFELGSANTSPGLEVVAETGSPAALVAELDNSAAVLDVKYLMGSAPNGGLLPGETITGTVEASSAFTHVSVFAMIAPSNDSFVSANAIHVPRSGKAEVVFSPGYDAGTEANNELCDTAVPTNVGDPDSIPIPPPMRPFICVFTPTVPAPPFASVGAPGEGSILISRGFQGVGNLNPAQFDWRNPTAKITIKRVSVR